MKMEMNRIMKTAEVTNWLRIKAWLHRKNVGSFYWAVNMLLNGSICTSSGWWCKSEVFIGLITRKTDGKKFIGITKELYIHDCFIGYEMCPLDDVELRVFPTMNNWIVSKTDGKNLIK